MIPFDTVLVSGGGLVLSPGGSDLLLAALSAGILGMGLSDITAGITGRLSGDEESGEVDGDDDFMGSGEDDDWDDDDAFGDVDDWDEDGDDFDDFGEDGGALDEIEPRLDEVENELASISSTMGTVRSENEAITETVEDIEDNIRKLLEIYEMVTRGVNPFVDDVEGSAGMGGGSFGLFEGDSSGGGGGGGGSEDLDSDVADADADSFFEDDWGDDEFEVDEGFDDGGFDDELDEPEPQVDSAGSESADGGKTFDQLKSEYEGGDAEWADDEGEPPEGSMTVASTETAEVATTATGESTDASEPMDAPADSDGALDDDVGHEERTESEEAETVEAETDPGPDAVDETTSPAESTTNAGNVSAAREDGKPYLHALPGGFATELLVIEWLSYLRSQSSTPEALRAIRYYETIGWIGEPAADSLAKFLTGLSGNEGGLPPTGGTQLTVDHHTRSLRYIGRLGGADVQIERLEWSGPPRNAGLEGGKQRGIQR